MDGSAGEKVLSLVVLSEQSEGLPHEVAECRAFNRQQLDKVANKHGLQVAVKKGSAGHKPGLSGLRGATEKAQIIDHALAQDSNNNLQRRKRDQPVLLREIGRVDGGVMTPA